MGIEIQGRKWGGGRRARARQLGIRREKGTKAQGHKGTKGGSSLRPRIRNWGEGNRNMDAQDGQDEKAPKGAGRKVK